MKIKNAIFHLKLFFILMIFFFCHSGQALTEVRSCQSLFSQFDSHYDDKAKSLKSIIETSGKSILEKEGNKKYRSPFAVERGLSEYIRKFGVEFKTRLFNLTSSDVVLDAGCGDAYLSDSLLESQQAQYIGVTFELLKRPLEFFNQRLNSFKTKLFTGRFFEEIADAELRSRGPIKLITDLYGIMSYTSRPDVVLKKYLDLLEKDGALYIFGPRMSVGKDFDFIVWLKKVKGINIEVIRSQTGDITETAYLITKNAASYEIPEVELTSSRPGKPPTRSFKYTGAYLVSF